MEVNEKTVFVITLLGTLLIILGIIFSIVDFYNDYQCSTTTDWEYWESHNCIKYCKECKNENTRN